jgi:hypothetical protein
MVVLDEESLHCRHLTFDTSIKEMQGSKNCHARTLANATPVTPRISFES